MSLLCTPHPPFASIAMCDFPAADTLGNIASPTGAAISATPANNPSTGSGLNAPKQSATVNANYGGGDSYKVMGTESGF